jgi:hypothetical protein
VDTVPLAREVFDRAAAQGHGGSDFSVVISLQAQRAGALVGGGR